MTQEPTPQNDPHYVVITGTNIRSTLPGKDYTPKVYDSEQIAQDAIDAKIANRKALGLPATAPASPISVTEYDRKYSAYRNILQE